MSDPAFAIVTARGLRLRDAPSLTGRILEVLARGSTVRVLETNADALWSRVEQPIATGGRTGWMASKYLAALDHPIARAGLHDEPWLAAAMHELGVKELEGGGNNPRVLMYLQSTDLDRAMAAQDETPWCSAFVNWCLEVTGYAGTNSAAARSWLGWGASLSVPRRGAITILSRTGGGHVGFFVSETASKVRLLGGNQGNQVCVADYDRARVLGYRVP